jgi:hypothetical protein
VYLMVVAAHQLDWVYDEMLHDFSPLHHLSSQNQHPIIHNNKSIIDPQLSDNEYGRREGGIVYL